MIDRLVETMLPNEAAIIAYGLPKQADCVDFVDYRRKHYEFHNAVEATHRLRKTLMVAFWFAMKELEERAAQGEKL